MSDLTMILFVLLVVGAIAVLLMLAVLLQGSIQLRTWQPKSLSSYEKRSAKRTPLWRWHLP
jgi:hypothetical protein